MNWNQNFVTVKVTRYLTILFFANFSLIFLDLKKPFIKLFREFSYKKMELDYYHHKLSVQFASRKLNLRNYMLKVNYRNTWTRCEVCSGLTIKHQNDVIDVVLVSLLLTLNISYILFYYFYC